MGEVEVDRLGGGARTPAATGIVAAGKSVPEVAADGVPFAVAAAVAAPRGVGKECRQESHQLEIAVWHWSQTEQHHSCYY